MAEPRKRPVARKAAGGKAPARRQKVAPPTSPDLGPGFVHSTFGPFASMALVVMPAERAFELVEAKEVAPAQAFLVDAVRVELEELEKRRAGVSTSALAATAVALALEIASPASSSTSRSMLAARLMEAMKRVAAAAPAEDTGGDALDELQRKRDERRAAAAKAGA